MLVEIKEAKTHSYGVRACVVCAARQLLLQSLPVPAAREGIVTDIYLLNVSESTVLDKLKGVEIKGRGLCVLECCDRTAKLLSFLYISDCRL